MPTTVGECPRMPANPGRMGGSVVRALAVDSPMIAYCCP